MEGIKIVCEQNQLEINSPQVNKNTQNNNYY